MSVGTSTITEETAREQSRRWNKWREVTDI
jgi:hypothetical protein